MSKAPRRGLTGIAAPAEAGHTAGTVDERVGGSVGASEDAEAGAPPPGVGVPEVLQAPELTGAAVLGTAVLPG